MYNENILIIDGEKYFWDNINECLIPYEFDYNDKPNTNNNIQDYLSNSSNSSNSLNLKLANHITFFYNENRIVYLNQIIKEINLYEYITDIFIHTNTNYDFSLKLEKNINGKTSIIVHDLSTIDPKFLTWKCRDLLKQQVNLYDIFIYIEDDIVVPKAALEYWLKFKDIVISKNYNLGFFRIETDDQKNEYTTDIALSPDGTQSGQLSKKICINNINYIVNDTNSYCAFWIYDKNEFLKFTNSYQYDINNIDGYSIRERSSIGLHGLHNNWYKNTIIPLNELNENQVCDACKIYHITNNYVHQKDGWKLYLFNDIIKKEN